MKRCKKIWNITDFKANKRKHCYRILTSIIVCGLLLLLSFSVAQVNADNDKPLEEVTLQLSWYHEFHFAGYYAAQLKGYYKEEGLEVEIKERKPDLLPADAVLSGEADFGNATSDLMFLRMQGKPVVALAVIMQHSPWVLLVRADSGITVPEDLIGKTVSMDMSYRDVEVQAMFKDENISTEDMTIVRKKPGVENLINSTVDAQVSYITSQPFELQKQGYEPRVIRPVNYGVDFYGDTLFTSERQIREHPQRVAAFRRASLRGWQYAMNHMEELIDYIYSTYYADPTKATIPYSLEHLRFEAQVMAQDLMHPKLIQIGHMNPYRWQHIAKTYVALGMAEPINTLNGFIYDPNPGSEHKWMYWTIGIIVAILVLVGVCVAILYVFNKRLNRDVQLRTSELSQTNKALVQEISDRKVAEEKITSIAHILEESLNEIYIFDAKTFRFIRVNKGARLNLGYSMEELSSLTPLDLKPDMTSPYFSKLLEPLRTGEKEKIQFITLHRRKDGSLYDVEVHLQLSTFQSIPVFVAIILDITERNRMETALQNSEERYRFLVEATTSVIWITDGSGGFVDPQPSWEKYTGQPWSEHKDFGWTKKIHPDDIEDILKVWKKAILELSLYETGGRIWNANLNEWRDFEVRAVPIMNLDGALREWVGIITDITGRKQVDREIKELNESLEDRVSERTAEVVKLSHAVEQSSSSVVITDVKGDIEYVNPRFTQTTGYSSEEAIGQNPRILKSGEQNAEFYRELWSTISSGREWKGEFHNKRKNGELYWEFASISPIIDKEGVVTSFVAVKEDITERKSMEEELRTLNDSLEERVSERTVELAKSNEELKNSKETLTKAQRIARMGNWVWDIVDNKLHWSDEIYRIFGLGPQEFDATFDAFMNFVHPDDKVVVRRAVNEAIYKSIPYNIEHRVVLSDGTERIVHEQAEVTFDENGKPLKMLGTVQDITDLKKREEELIKAQKLDSIGLLAGGIAHDFNNYLQGIMGYIMLAQASSDKGVKEVLKEAEKLIFQSKDLSSKLITFSKGGDPIKKTILISQLIIDSVSLVMSASRFDCQIAVPDSLWPVDADKGQLGQVFSNIIINAKQAMPDGGKVDTSAENIEVNKNELYHLKEGKYVKVTIKDHGTGISDENMQKIFDPYFTTKKSGSGLGLSTCFSIIKKHGGHISVESEPGVGTTFNIYLPASMTLMEKTLEPSEAKIESTETD